MFFLHHAGLYVSLYSLVMANIANWKIPMFNGQIHYFYGDSNHSNVSHYQRVLDFLGKWCSLCHTSRLYWFNFGTSGVPGHNPRVRVWILCTFFGGFGWATLAMCIYIYTHDLHVICIIPLVDTLKLLDRNIWEELFKIHQAYIHNIYIYAYMIYIYIYIYTSYLCTHANMHLI